MNRFLLCILLGSSLMCGAQPYDLLLSGGRIIDGTGNAWYHGDVAIAGGRIAAVGRIEKTHARRVIDVTGLVVAPGFIDAHTHIEKNDLAIPTADNFIHDGVTSVVTGNCGASNTDVAAYFRKLDSVRMSVNVATLVGHNSVRQEVMGTSQRDPTPEEQASMEALVAKAMRDGAVGLSSGLIYIPGTFSKTPEVVGLARAAARHQGVYASHIRSEGDGVTAAIEEAIHVGRAANIPVEISHFKVTYKSNWGRSAATLAQVDQARKEGVDVTVDQYPYVASSTTLNTVLPSWVFAGGGDSLRFRLNDQEIRNRIRSEMVKSLKAKKLRNFSYAVVARHDADTTVDGMNISEITKRRGRRPNARAEAETILEMVEAGSAQMVFFSMHEDDLRRIMAYPFSMFASDAGIARYGAGVPHPRTYGTNARVLGRYVRLEQVIRLEEAIRRMTSLPAQKFRLHDRGLIAPGRAADLVVFNEGTVEDRSTFRNPHQYASGIEYVVVNGVLTLETGSHTGARNGQVLRGPGFLPSE